MYAKIYELIKLFQFFSQTFSCNMDSNVYKQIIERCIFPFSLEHFNYDMKLHQDNDTKHNSKICKTALLDANIEWINFIKKSKLLIFSSV